MVGRSSGRAYAAAADAEDTAGVATAVDMLDAVEVVGIADAMDVRISDVDCLSANDPLGMSVGDYSAASSRLSIFPVDITSHTPPSGQNCKKSLLLCSRGM